VTPIGRVQGIENRAAALCGFRAGELSLMMSAAHREAPRDVLPAPMLPQLDRIALFADLDGTLAPIEATPQAVGPDASRRRLIDALTRGLSGRFAVVSGRSLADIDRVLENRVAAVAAVHGLVRRNPERDILTTAVDGPKLKVMLDTVRAFAADQTGLLVEDKGAAVALHYRLAPALGPSCRGLAHSLAAELALEIQEGDMVVELRAPGPDKGGAIGAFMAEAPFAGHAPVFLGDDFTDESGFETVQALGGFGVIIGARRPTVARYALADVAAARTWLQRAVDAAAR
jgi:trehalose 6-phosphate phosphatase